MNSSDVVYINPHNSILLIFEGYFPKPTTSFDKWQLDLLLLLLLLHHGPILGESIFMKLM
jgi:hypothetical protein